MLLSRAHSFSLDARYNHHDLIDRCLHGLEVYDDFADTGRGLRTTSEKKAGEVLLTIPQSDLIGTSTTDDRWRDQDESLTYRLLQLSLIHI